MRERIVMQRLVQPAVMAPVRLFVADQALRPQPDRRVGRPLVHGAWHAMQTADRSDEERGDSDVSGAHAHFDSATM